jgi:hypothetical protein
MRQLILPVGILVLLAVGVSVRSNTPGSTSTTVGVAQAAEQQRAGAGLSPQQFMAKLAKGLPVESWEHPF